MRILLDETFPPQAVDERPSRPKSAREMERTFSQKPVLACLDDLLEVGSDGAVMATPGAEAEEAGTAPARGVTISETRQASSGLSASSRPSLAQSEEITTTL